MIFKRAGVLEGGPYHGSVITWPEDKPRPHGFWMPGYHDTPLYSHDCYEAVPSDYTDHRGYYIYRWTPATKSQET